MYTCSFLFSILMITSICVNGIIIIIIIIYIM
jgi:hypothetical protein